MFTHFAISLSLVLLQRVLDDTEGFEEMEPLGAASSSGQDHSSFMFYSLNPGTFQGGRASARMTSNSNADRTRFVTLAAANSLGSLSSSRDEELGSACFSDSTPHNFFISELQSSESTNTDSEDVTLSDLVQLLL